MRFDWTRWALVEREIAADALSVVGEHGSLTWRELATTAEAFAAWLRAHTTRPIILRGHKELLFPAAILGAMLAGVTYVPIDSMLPDARVDSVIRDIQPDFVIDLRQSDRTGDIGSLAVRVAETGAGEPASEIVYILFTSGSSGVPKGVQITKDNLRDFADWLDHDFQLPFPGVHLNQAPFSFDLSVFELVRFLTTGGTLLLASRALQRDPERFVGWVAGQRCDVWISTPSFASTICREPRFIHQTFPSLRVFLFCGEVLPHALAKTLRERFAPARVINTYGPTEATVATTMVEVTDDLIRRYDPLPIGYVKPRTAIRILSPEPNDTDGEICIIGPNVSIGYLNRPDLNAEKFLEIDGARGYRTGDIGRFRDGLLFFLGRLDDQIKLHGFRIELGEIDACILQHGAAFLSAACTVPLRRGDSVRRLVAFVVPVANLPDPQSLTAGLRNILAQHLPDYMIPSEIVAVEAMPMTPNHKIDRARLLTAYQASSS